MGMMIANGMKIAAIAASVALMGFGSAQAANLVNNGDFSNPNVGGGWGMFSNGQVGAWNNTNGDSLEVGNSNVYGLGCINAACQSLEVNANTFDTVSQTIYGLTSGASYLVSWAYSARDGGGPQSLDVSFGGDHLATNTGSVSAWSNNAVRITANKTSELLQFQSANVGGNSSFGNEITNVSVAGVPEPATWALMTVGLLGLGAMIRRSRKQAAAAVAA